MYRTGTAAHALHAADDVAEPPPPDGRVCPERVGAGGPARSAAPARPTGLHVGEGWRRGSAARALGHG